MPPEIRPSKSPQPGSPGVVSNESLESAPVADTFQKEQPPKLDPDTAAKNAQSARQLANDTKNQDTQRIQILRNQLTEKLPEKKTQEPVQYSGPVKPPMELPGRMMTVTLYDANNNSIASQTVPLHNNAPIETLSGEINGGSINWEGGRTVQAKIGKKLDAQGRPTDGVSIEDWARKQGQGRARYVRIEISDAMLKEGANKTDSSAPTQNSSKQSKSPTAGKGSLGESPSTSVGASKSSSASGGGKPVENAPEGSSSKAGRNTKYPGEEKMGGRGHEDKGTVHRGNPSLNKKGGVHGKWDGNKEKVGYFYDPDKTGRGQQDVKHKNAAEGGMVGGTGKKGDDGVPAGGGVKPLIPVPKAIKPYMEVGMILADVGIAKIGDDLIKTAAKLGKRGQPPSDALKAAVKGKVDDFIKKETDTVTDAIKRDKDFASKSPTEQAEILKQAKEAVEETANSKIMSHLDHKIAQHQDYAQRAAKNPGKYSKDVMEDELKLADAARQAKEAMPPQKMSMNKSNEKNLAKSDKPGETKGANKTNRMSRPHQEIERDLREAQAEANRVRGEAERHIRDRTKDGKTSLEPDTTLNKKLEELAEGGDDIAELLLRDLEQVQERIRNLRAELENL